MNFRFQQWDIKIIEEAYDPIGFKEHATQCERTYRLGDKRTIPAVIYAIRVDGPAGQESSCLITGDRGATLLHDATIVLADSRLFLAISAWICCLEIPGLKMMWQQQVDFATCFGVYLSPDGEGLLSHGETEVEKVSFDGEIEWIAAGKDIFTGEFVLGPDHIDITDFNNQKYRIWISSGRISPVSQ